jgi:transposase
MGKPLSMDLRRRVIDAVDNGEGTLKEIAAHFRVGRTTICDILRRERLTGSIEPSTVRGHPPRAIDEAGLELIRQLVASTPDATVAEVAAAYNAQSSRPVHPETVGRAIRAMKLTRKKDPQSLGARPPRRPRVPTGLRHRDSRHRARAPGLPRRVWLQHGHDQALRPCAARTACLWQLPH